MKSFFKFFFASFLALVVFTVIAVLIVMGMVSIVSITSPSQVISRNSVLVLDLSKTFREQSQDNPLTDLVTSAEDIPGLYDVVRIIQYAQKDSSIRGIYIKAGNNSNMYATNEELRKALIDFKKSNKFIISYGEVISQKDYYVASVSDKVYCHPQGGVEWSGFSSNIYFFKGMLDKLEIQPQIFYAGKFKSATEPYRATQMTEPNRLQTHVWMEDLYSHFLSNTNTDRKVDTLELRKLASEGLIQTANDALKYHLVDGLKYEDEVMQELSQVLKQKDIEKINFVSLSNYAKSISFSTSGSDNIALIYAQGDIVSGKGSDDQIGSDTYSALIRKARLDKSVKAIVFRVNSPGGSALASDAIWHEIKIARQEKPVIVSMGDYAASGGYYISCAADSIFAEPSTITGSIGVFTIIPNIQPFMKNKLGITFDGVKTGQYADMGSITRPLSPVEQRFVQAGVDSIYYTFKSRVAEGRKRDIEYIDSIAQGRVWTGERAVELGLVDRLGSLQEAIDCAASMAKVQSFRLKEYPEKKSLLDQLFNASAGKTIKENEIKKEIGAEQYEFLKKIKNLQSLFGTSQARLPFHMDLN